MNGPTLRQQAGYLRRLLRRGEIEFVDPATQKKLPVLIELSGDAIRLTPLLDDGAPLEGLTDQDLRWARALRKLRAILSLAEVEELLEAVEREERSEKLIRAFS